ncbi:hypothetical protein GCM10022276_14180 [Sphingomonas limnosediminicola]|uniref:Uncharacterized protein n=1 Tax=Sphingomonas limnosediminicola TaxID=940133 RepID=A0ABP7LCJ4_9SPHN
MRALPDGWRLPAREIEPLVRTRLLGLLKDPVELLAQVTNDMPSPAELNLLAERSKEAASALTGPRAQAANRLRGLISEVRLGQEQVSIQLNPTELEKLLGIQIARVLIKVDIAGRLKRSGHVTRLIQRDGSAASATVDRTLVKAIVQARNWWRELQADTALTIEDLAQREGLTAAYVVRIVRLAFLSPAMLKSVIEGTLPTHLTVKRLTAPDAVPARWERQFV